MAETNCYKTTDWLEAVMANGAIVVGPDGQAKLSPSIEKLAGAINEVLAGGDVEVTVKTAGDAAVREELKRKLDAIVASANKVSGFAAFAP